MVTPSVFIVVGLGYGDEGKGTVTDYLCSISEDSLVIRFNGGHQAGHTVSIKDYRKHVFSCFGSGTLRGVPTYWSKYCTVSPQDIITEYNILKLKANLLLDNKCPVTTHYDFLYNRMIEDRRGAKRYGSCGVGFGATIDRHYHNEITFFAEDLINKDLINEKLSAVKEYYESKFFEESLKDFDSYDHDLEDKQFLDYTEKLMSLTDIRFVNESDVFNQSWKTLIFEGAQGILLDQRFGERPFITKSNTTSSNAINLIKSNYVLELNNIEIFYVTRTYSTRHGNGSFPEVKLNLINNEKETNVKNTYQGRFKVGLLDIEKLQYALDCDNLISASCSKNLVITCVDQLGNEHLEYLDKNVKKKIDVSQFAKLLCTSFNSVLYSTSEYSDGFISEL